MKIKFKWIPFILVAQLIANTSHAQTSFSKYELSVGRGTSLYRSIKSDQYLLTLRVPHLTGKVGSFGYESDINLEIINENSSTTYLVGFVPMFKYGLDKLVKNLFFKAGIGINYINNYFIGNRKIGGHFVFSDMISLGLNLYSGSNFSLDLSYLLRHISNAGLYISNEGYNSHYIIISVPFRMNN